MEIRATDLQKSYGSVTALDGLSLTVPAGSTFGLLGTNGAGKTTLFRLLVGHDRPDSGTVRVGDVSVPEAGSRIREHVGYLPEQTGFPAALTGREVLESLARIRGLSSAGARIEEVLETVGLADSADRPTEGYSNGMGRRLGLATALLSDPAVLLLDEPTAGLDPLGVADFHRIVESIDAREDATVLLSSHALAEVERLCDTVAVVDDGRVRTVEAVDDLDGDLRSTFEAVVLGSSATQRAGEVEP